MEVQALRVTCKLLAVLQNNRENVAEGRSGKRSHASASLASFHQPSWPRLGSKHSCPGVYVVWAMVWTGGVVVTAH
jgi:hypothetical protein